MHPIDVWIIFKMKTILGGYHDLYLLVADFFEKVIDMCLEYYGLGPCHCFSSPGLNWDAML